MGVVKKKDSTRKMFPKVDTEKNKPSFLCGISLCNSIEEDGQYYAEVSKISENDDGTRLVKFVPFKMKAGHRVYFEPVYITLERTNTYNSPAGQFFTLFNEARHWGDIKDRA